MYYFNVPNLNVLNRVVLIQKKRLLKGPSFEFT